MNSLRVSLPEISQRNSAYYHENNMNSPKHWWMEDHCRLSSSSATLYHGYFYLLKANFAKQLQWKMFKLNWQWWCIINNLVFASKGGNNLCVPFSFLKKSHEHICHLRYPHAQHLHLGWSHTIKSNTSNQVLRFYYKLLWRTQHTE